jgi:hypothetical protein
MGTRLQELFAAHPNVDPTAMGFPVKRQQEPIWNGALPVMSPEPARAEAFIQPASAATWTRAIVRLRKPLLALAAAALFVRQARKRSSK